LEGCGISSQTVELQLIGAVRGSVEREGVGKKKDLAKSRSPEWFRSVFADREMSEWRIAEKGATRWIDGIYAKRNGK